jgi:hypothetical protein
MCQSFFFLNGTVPFIYFVLTCIYIVWAMFPLLLPMPPSFPGKTCSTLFSDFVEEKT